MNKREVSKLIKDVRRSILEDAKPIPSQLLRKCMEIAKYLRKEKDYQWMKLEYNGYLLSDEITREIRDRHFPDYRRCGATLLVGDTSALPSMTTGEAWQVYSTPRSTVKILSVYESVLTIEISFLNDNSLSIMLPDMPNIVAVFGVDEVRRLCHSLLQRILDFVNRMEEELKPEFWKRFAYPFLSILLIIVTALTTLYRAHLWQLIIVSYNFIMTNPILSSFVAGIILAAIPAMLRLRKRKR